MVDLISRRSLLRKPSRGELLFLGLLALFIAFDRASGDGSGDGGWTGGLTWFQSPVAAQINSKDYDGDGLVIEINEVTFDRLGRNEWTRADLAQLLESLGEAQPRKVVVDRQYFAGNSADGVDRLRSAISAQSFDVFWIASLGEDDLRRLQNNGAPPAIEEQSPAEVRLDPGAQGLAIPTAMLFNDYSSSAPWDAWYTLPADERMLLSAAAVLSDGSAPSSNLFNIDVSYDAASVPSLNASDILNGDFRAEDVRGKKVIIAVVSNLVRDTIITPSDPYTSRATATLFAAQTLENGPPIKIGGNLGLLVGVLGALAWLFIRRPIGRWIAFAAFVYLCLSPILFERALIFQWTSQGIFVLLMVALRKVWMRGGETVKEYRSAAETKSRFLAQASHDLRQPIHAIGLLSERLSQTDLTPDQRELVSKISWSVGNASGMFRALLDVAAIESGTLQKRIEPVSINELLAEIDNQNALVAEQAGVDLRLVPSDLIVMTDRALLGSMLQNLVTNAIKYAPGRKIVVGCRRRGKRVSIHVVDNGPGIPAAELEHVKKEFYRASDQSRLGTDNKGLGLAIVNRLALMLDLVFVLHSEEGKGTSARIRGLPIATDNVREKKDSPSRKLPLSGLRVVVADDDAETLRSTESLLEQWGCEVAAFARFPDKVPPCDVMLSDFDFGESGTLGDQGAELARITDMGAQLIILSGHHPDTIREALGGDRGLVLSKPLRAAELRSALMSARIAAGASS